MEISIIIGIIESYESMREAMKINILDKEHKTNDLVTITDLFSGEKYYRIPDYQRGYSWSSDKEFLELWKDIIRLYHTNNQNRKHYTGMITLDQINDVLDINYENLLGTNSFYIVDGQQRITSIVIILKTIFDYAKENEITEIVNNKRFQVLLKGESDIRRFGYSTKRQDGADDYFNQRIYQGNKNLPMPNQYFINIDEAQRKIEKELDKYDEHKISQIIEIILDRLVFNLYFITEDFDVRVTFETMNNRGKSLTSLELLKNRLMYLSTYFQSDSNNYSGRLQKRIDIAWKNIYDRLNFKDSRLSDDEYLKAHWIVYQRLNKKKGDAFIEDILNSEFSTDSGTFYNHCQELEYKEAFQILNSYVESLDKFSLYWSAVNVPDNIQFHLDSLSLEGIKKLSRLPNNLYMKSAIMVVLASEKIDPVDKIKFYSKLERFVFINKLLAQDKNDLSFLTTYAKDLLNEKEAHKEKMEALINILDLHFLAINKERVVKALDIFKNYIDNRPSFYYGWNGLSYFLYEYNESISIYNAAKIEWYKVNTTSIEHVLPQSNQREYWKTAFEGYLGTHKESNIINSLGNLLMLSSGSENSSLKNYSYPVKREMDIETKKFSYVDGSRSAREISEKRHWTPKEVYERSITLLNFLHDNWLKEYITITEWNELVDKFNLVNFIYQELNESDYQALTEKLDSIDVSTEREQAYQDSIRQKREDYLVNQILDYFDEDVFHMVSNSKALSYKEARYSFVIKRDKDKKPVSIKIATLIEQKKYQIEYDYFKNTVKVNHWEDDQRIYFNGDSELHEELKMFLRSFYRYIRKARQRSKPVFINV